MRLVMMCVVLLSCSSAFAQTIQLQPPWSVPEGGKLELSASGLACGDKALGPPVVKFGPNITLNLDPAPSSKWSITLPPSAIPDAYEVSLTCGGKTSAPVWLTVVPARPQVTCVSNPAPKPTEKRPDGWRCNRASPWEIRLGDRIEVQVHGLDQLRQSAGGKPLRLFIAGIELRNLQLTHSKFEPATQNSVLYTRLDFEDEPEAVRDAWVQLLQTGRNRTTVEVSIGPEGGPQFPTTAYANVNVYPIGWSIFTSVVVLGLATLLIWLGAKSNLLRGPACAEGPAPYSLARHQMASWFLVVIVAYLFVAMSTGAAAVTSPTALILIGISGATGLAAVAIDANQRQESIRAREALKAERVALEESLAALRAQLAQAPAGSPDAVQLVATIHTKTQRHAEVMAQLQKREPTGQPTRGWLRDLISDENGVSFHRLQIVGWTVVLVGVFVRSVWRDVAMPDFDTTTLALMGVSSGTYVGFKLPQ